MKPNTKKMYVGVGVVTVFVALNVAVFFFHTRHGGPEHWTEHTFAGKVSEVTKERVTAVDALGTQRIFVITPHTKVIKGRDVSPVETLTKGTYVMIHSAPMPELQEEATEIRILTTDPRIVPKNKP